MSTHFSGNTFLPFLCILAVLQSTSNKEEIKISRQLGVLVCQVSQPNPLAKLLYIQVFSFGSVGTEQTCLQKL